MTSRTKGRIALIAFGIVAVFGALTSVWEPAHWSLAVLGSYIRSSAPPPILGTVRCTDLPKCTRATADFNAILHRRFPVGSSAKVLETTLVAQNFEAPLSPGHVLSYGWGHLPCSSGVTVRWTADAKNKITSVGGVYFYGCS